MTNLIRNISYDQSEIIRNILRLHTSGGKIDCDPIYSIWAFYRGRNQSHARKYNSFLWVFQMSEKRIDYTGACDQ